MLLRANRHQDKVSSMVEEIKILSNWLGSQLSERGNNFVKDDMTTDDDPITGDIKTSVPYKDI